MIQSLIYTSRPNLLIEDSCAEALAEQSSVRNKALGITGFLYIQEDRIFQYLEGKGQYLRPLYERISRDPRHSVIDCYELPKRSARVVECWSMRLVSDADIRKSGVLALLERFLFKPKISSVRATELSSVTSALIPAVVELDRFRQRLRA